MCFPYQWLWEAGSRLETSAPEHKDEDHKDEKEKAQQQQQRQQRQGEQGEQGEQEERGEQEGPQVARLGGRCAPQTVEFVLPDELCNASLAELRAQARPAPLASSHSALLSSDPSNCL